MANVNNFDTTAFSIDGARHRGELLRAFAYAATGGREGVVTAFDCRVSQLSTAGQSVQISAGAVAMRNRSAGAVAQSYVVENRATSTCDIAPTGGSGRSDLVIVRAKDPQYSPWQTIVGANDPATFQYVEPMVIQNVPNSTTSAAQLGLGYSAFALARIDIPAGTSNITDAMIHDLRTVIQPAHAPEEARTVRTGTGPGTPTVLLAGHTTWQWFPIINELIYCPVWATRATMVVMVNSILLRGAPTLGGLRAEYGWNSDDSLITTDTVGLHSEGNIALRQTLVLAKTFAIPASFRDKAHYVRTGGYMNLNTDPNSTVTMDNYSSYVVDLQFEEVAD